jgi:hypothetical protein
MFPFISVGSCGRGFSYGFDWDNQGPSRKDRLRYKLQYLKRAQDELETKLASVKASIATVEKQLSEEDSATA